MDGLSGERVRLRLWRPEDREPWAKLNSNTNVMRHFPGTLSRGESDALADRIEDHFTEHGFGLWALEVPGAFDFGGVVGLKQVPFEAHFTPAIEVGWRLGPWAQGSGYCTEAARLALDFGFEELGLEEIVSFTVPANRSSWRVMEEIGMTRDPSDDFEHPSLPIGHALRHHVLYRIHSVD
ncbi:MAG: GNAT family N-acetyltransferase [Myxococcota bacterium]